MDDLDSNHSEKALHQNDRNQSKWAIYASRNRDGFWARRNRGSRSFCERILCVTKQENNPSFPACWGSPDFTADRPTKIVIWKFWRPGRVRISRLMLLDTYGSWNARIRGSPLTFPEFPNLVIWYFSNFQILILHMTLFWYTPIFSLPRYSWWSPDSWFSDNVDIFCKKNHGKILSEQKVMASYFGAVF